MHLVEAEKLASSESNKHGEGTTALDEDSFGEGMNPVDFHCLNHEFGSDYINYLMMQGVKPVSSRIPIQHQDILRLPANERKAWDSACQDEIDALWK